MGSFFVITTIFRLHPGKQTLATKYPFKIPEDAWFYLDGSRNGFTPSKGTFITDKTIKPWAKGHPIIAKGSNDTTDRDG